MLFDLFKQKSKATAIKTLGQMGEEFAQKEYEKKGYCIVAANEYNKKGKRLGEIDFVAKTNKVLAFVEVKTRSGSTGKFGTAAEAVDIYKQRKLLKAVKLYLNSHQEFSGLQPQIDVCVVEWSEIDRAFKPAIILMNAVEDWN